MNAPVQTAEARELALAGMGASRLRKEDARFIQGKGNYVDDIKMPGMLHMDIVRSPIAHGRIVKINKEAALAIPGVHAVLTADDLKPLKLHWMPRWRATWQLCWPTRKCTSRCRKLPSLSLTTATLPPTR